MITEERIKNYLNGLRELQQHIIKTKGIINGKERDAILIKHKMSKDVLTRCIELNYIKRTGRGEYKFILTDIHPIHSRKVIEGTNRVVTETINKKKQNTPDVTPSTIKRVKHKKKKSKPTSITTSNIIPTPKQEKRQVSILWGLFKWTKN